LTGCVAISTPSRMTAATEENADLSRTGSRIKTSNVGPATARNLIMTGAVSLWNAVSGRSTCGNTRMMAIKNRSGKSIAIRTQSILGQIVVRGVTATLFSARPLAHTLRGALGLRRSARPVPTSMSNRFVPLQRLANFCRTRPQPSAQEVAD